MTNSLIISESQSTPRAPIPAGMYVARCYGLIQIGRYMEYSQFLKKDVYENKIRITWELPTLTKEFKEGEGEKPYSISKEFTMSLNEKGNLRPFLNSWRGRSFTEDELKGFDILAIVGAPCMLNIIHKKSKDGAKAYEEIATITPLMKGVEMPSAFNEKQILTYSNWNQALFDSLPDFIKDKMKKSEEYLAMVSPSHVESAVSPVNAESSGDEALPF